MGAGHTFFGHSGSHDITGKLLLAEKIKLQFGNHRYCNILIHLIEITQVVVLRHRHHVLLSKKVTLAEKDMGHSTTAKFIRWHLQKFAIPTKALVGI